MAVSYVYAIRLAPIITSWLPLF